jgi:predicted nucleotidyltransferase
MNRDEIIETISKHKKEIDAFGVKSLALFGSIARNEAGASSDVDILVEFRPEARIGLFTFARLRRRLSELLDIDVDLVTPDAVRPEMRKEILREAVRAA